MAANKQEKALAQQNNGGEEEAAKELLLTHLGLLQQMSQNHVYIVQQQRRTPEEEDERRNRSAELFRHLPTSGQNRWSGLNFGANQGLNTQSQFLITLPDYAGEEAATAERQTPRCSFFERAWHCVRGGAAEPVATATSTETDLDGNQTEDGAGEGKRSKYSASYKL